MALRLSVCGLSGILCEMDGDASAMVLKLKQRVHAATGIPVKEQRLFAGSTELKSTTRIGDALGGARQRLQSSRWSAAPPLTRSGRWLRCPSNTAFATSRQPRARIMRSSWPH